MKKVYLEVFVVMTFQKALLASNMVKGMYKRGTILSCSNLIANCLELYLCICLVWSKVKLAF